MSIKEKIESLLNKEKIKDAERLIRKIKKEKEYYYYYAEIMRMKGFITKAIFLFKKALNEINDRDIKLKIFIRIMSLLRTIGDINDLKKYIILTQRLKANSEEFLLEKAMCLRLFEKYNQANKIFKKLKKIYTKNKDYQGISYILWAQGGIYRTKGSINKSINSYKKAKKYALKAKDKTLYLYSNLGLAGSLRIAAKLKESYKTYYSCIKLSPNDDMFAKGYSYCGAANALRQMGFYKKAIKYYNKALKYYLKIKDNADIALVLWGLAECYKKYDINKALVYLKKAKKYLKDKKEIRGKILILFSESYIRYIKGDIKKAKNLFNRAMKLSKKHSMYIYLENFG
ncbi:MAG: tetratricopeptide repeat protein [Elusimicrobiales bacterium]|nr:tetratricopeptide repeat protein [Elusimicrobiales bacterium]